jgi:hypothetical protein
MTLPVQRKRHPELMLVLVDVGADHLSRRSELRRCEKRRSALENVVDTAELSDLTTQPNQLGTLIGRCPGPVAGIDVVTFDPAAHYVAQSGRALWRNRGSGSVRSAALQCRLPRSMALIRHAIWHHRGVSAACVRPEA